MQAYYRLVKSGDIKGEFEENKIFHYLHQYPTRKYCIYLA